MFGRSQPARDRGYEIDTGLLLCVTPREIQLIARRITLKAFANFSVINDDAIEGKLVIRRALRLNTEIRSLLLQTHSQAVADLHSQVEFEKRYFTVHGVAC